MSQKISIFTPLAYIFVMITSLVIFSTVYRQRKLKQVAGLKPVYETSFARDNYFYSKNLLEQQVADKVPVAKRIPESTIKAALVRWAGEDVRQLIKMKQSKETLTQLHQKGFVGDSTFTKFTTSEKAIELEIQEIAKEANSYKEGFGQAIFALASDVSQTDGIRTRLANAQKLKVEYQERLNKIRKDALAELEGTSEKTE